VFADALFLASLFLLIVRSGVSQTSIISTLLIHNGIDHKSHRAGL
jgi:hypothetical protein